MPDVSTQTEKPKRKPRTKYEPKTIKIKLIKQKPPIKPLTPPKLIIMFDDIF